MTNVKQQAVPRPWSSRTPVHLAVLVYFACSYSSLPALFWKVFMKAEKRLRAKIVFFWVAQEIISWREGRHIQREE